MTAPGPPVSEQRLLHIFRAATVGRNNREKEWGQNEFISLAHRMNDDDQTWRRVVTIFHQHQAVLRPNPLIRFQTLCPFDDEREWARLLLLERARREEETELLELVLQELLKRKADLSDDLLKRLRKEWPTASWVAEEIRLRCRQRSDTRAERWRESIKAFGGQRFLPQFFVQDNWAKNDHCPEQ